jgi:hypothetical protein
LPVAPGAIVPHRDDHADRIEPVLELARVELALLSSCRRRHPRRRKYCSIIADPAVVGILRVRELAARVGGALVDLANSIFLNLSVSL